MQEMKKSLLSESVRAKIDDWLKRYPPEQKRSGVLQALKYAQEENKGWLSEEPMTYTARHR